MGDIPRCRSITESSLVESILEHNTQLGVMQYSPQYSDEEFVYRHIVVHRKVMKKAKEILNGKNVQRNKKRPTLSIKNDSKEDTLLPYEDVVQKLQIHMSSDWKLYLIHERDCTFCFRRPRRDQK